MNAGGGSVDGTDWKARGGNEQTNSYKTDYYSHAEGIEHTTKAPAEPEKIRSLMCGFGCQRPGLQGRYLDAGA